MGDGRRRTLVWRLYALGFTQLVVLAIAVSVVGVLLRPAPPGAPSGAFDAARPSSYETHPPPTGADPGPSTGAPRRGGPPRPPSPWPPLVTFFVSGLVIVGIGSLVMARSIVEPLEILSQTARAFGDGDLSARTGMTEAGELGEVGRAFDEMAERLRTLLVAERELLANVSHELRTPLARIRVALDLVEAGDGSDHASLEGIQADLGEIESLIDDILTTTRLELAGGRPPGGAYALRAEDVSSLALCEWAAERFSARHPCRILRVSADDGLPRVRVDPALFRRAIDNLLDNADKYSPDTGSAIELRAFCDGDSVAFEVGDQGVGIKSEDLAWLFTPFFRGERSRSRGTGGVGLGLTLSKRIAEAHGGSIRVVSEPGRGATFQLRVPSRAPDSDVG
jgi:signal transduction histidine kinase